MQSYGSFYLVLVFNFILQFTFDLNLPFFHHFHARIRMLEIKFPFSIKSKIELFCLNLFWINSQKVYGFIKMTLLFKSI